MAKKVIVTEEAWLDINDANDYYNQVSISVRKRFEEELILFLEKLKTGVISFQKYKQKYRKVNMSSFPFKIYYKEDDNTIIVAAFIHAARGSRFLKRRLF